MGYSPEASATTTWVSFFMPPTLPPSFLSSIVLPESKVRSPGIAGSLGSPTARMLPCPARETISVAASPTFTCGGSSRASIVKRPTAPAQLGGRPLAGIAFTSIVIGGLSTVRGSLAEKPPNRLNGS